MIDKPLIQNPLAGGGGTSLEDLARLRGGELIESINAQKPIQEINDKVKANLEVRPGITPPSNLGSTSSGLQPPRFGMGLGFPGMKSLEEGLLFLPDKDNPRSEEEIQAMYKQAQEEAAKQRREGFLGQVVLPGEYSYEEFKATNLFGFKRNPNLPDSAYKDFDVSGVAGFDTPEAADPNNLIGGYTPPTGGTFNDMPLVPETKEPPVSTKAEPFDRVGEQLVGFTDQFNGLTERLNKIEEGIASLLENRDQPFRMNRMNLEPSFTRSGLRSFYNPFREFYGQN